MARYQRGDVLLVHYVFEDRSTGELVNKPRPVVVFEESSHNERLVIQCTKKNRSDKLPGIWVLKDSPEGKKMGIKMDTFINVTEMIEIAFDDVIERLGSCPFMERIDDLVDNSKD